MRKKRDWQRQRSSHARVLEGLARLHREVRPMATGKAEVRQISKSSS